VCVSSSSIIELERLRLNLLLALELDTTGEQNGGFVLTKLAMCRQGSSLLWLDLNFARAPMGAQSALAECMYANARCQPVSRAAKPAARSQSRRPQRGLTWPGGRLVMIHELASRASGADWPVACAL